MDSSKSTTEKITTRLTYLILLLIAVFGGFLLWQTLFAPRHKGKPVSYWVDLACSSSIDSVRAANELKEIGPSVIPYLTRKLQLKDTALRRATIHAKKNWPHTLAKWLPDLETVDVIRSRAVENLFPFGTNAIPVLIKLIRDSDSDVSCQAIMNLGFIGPEAKAALPMLIDVSTNGKNDPMNRTQAALAIWSINHQAEFVLQDFESHLKSPLLDVDVLFPLGPLAAPEVSNLVNLLEDDSIAEANRARAARLLGNIGIKNEAIITALINATKETNVTLAAFSAFALKSLDTNYMSLALSCRMKDCLRTYRRTKTIDEIGNIFWRSLEQQQGWDVKTLGPSLKELSTNSDEQIRSIAAAALECFKSRSSNSASIK